MTTLSESLATASKTLQAGKIDEAESMFKQIVSTHPEHVESIHNLGLIAFQRGDFEGATRNIQLAIQINANDPALHSNLGNVFQARGKLDEAVHSYRRALKLNPAFVGALLNLGNVLLELHRVDEAVTCFLNAIELKPESAEAYNFLGDALSEQSKTDKAAGCYQKAIKFNPKYAQAYNNLGSLLLRQKEFENASKCFLKALEINPGFIDAMCNMGNISRELRQFDQAISIYVRAIQLAPDFFQAHNNLGLAYLESGNVSEAIECFQRALAIKPNSAEVLNNLGNALRDRGELDSALEMYGKSLKLHPNFVDAHCNRGIALKDAGRFEEAIRSYDLALQLAPHSCEAKFGKSVIHLLQGNWAEAWPLYENRLGTKEFSLPNFSQPRWDGSDLGGKTILLIPEQGLGDSIQFARYASKVQERGGNVVLLCPQALRDLFQDLPGVNRIVTIQDPLPTFDVYCSLLSLPGIFNTTVETIPSTVPYLKAKEDLVVRWKKKLASIPGFKLGISWQGNPSFRDDRERSIALQCFEPLARVSNVHLVSLQKGFGSEQLLDLESFHVYDYTDEIDIEFGPFMDTAAIMKNLDLVISVDTVTSHLAGALGVPVWNLLSPVPHWPFLLSGEKTGWYPTMRLLRRKTSDRGQFLIEVADALKEHLGQA